MCVKPRKSNVSGLPSAWPDCRRSCSRLIAFKLVVTNITAYMSIIGVHTGYAVLAQIRFSRRSGNLRIAAVRLACDVCPAIRGRDALPRRMPHDGEAEGNPAARTSTSCRNVFVVLRHQQFQAGIRDDSSRRSAGGLDRAPTRVQRADRYDRRSGC